MEQILYTKTYQEYKAELDTELQRTAEGFVRIGYLLKVARDTGILEESPYQTVTEFARAEYGIDKTMVSRFISINDRFSENGYSDQLKEQYKGYGYAKLTLMLSLPDEINEELSPSYSKAEIQAIKDEVDEERAISDLEVMMESHPVPAPAKGLLNMLIRQLGEDTPELYVQMAGIMGLAELQEWTRKAREILAPDAEKQYSIRISGTGRFLMSIRETEDTITVTALRTLEKTHCTYQELCDAWEQILPPVNGKPDTDWTEEQCRTSWELEYGREYPGKVKVAPVQQPAKPQKTKVTPNPRKESKVQKAPKPTPARAEPPKKDNPPTPKPEKPESTGTEEQTGMEAAGQSIRKLETEEQLPQEEKPGVPEPENLESTGTEEKAASIIEFAPGMRVRNKTGDLKYPQSVATVIGRHVGCDAWDVKWDDIPMTKVIFDTERKKFEIAEEQGAQPPEKDGQADIPAVEQLLGQTGMEQATEEPEEQQIRQTYPAAAGQEPDKELDTEWKEQKKVLLEHLKQINDENFSISRDLSDLAALTIKLFRKELIDMAALIEKELLRRGVSF